MDSCARSFFFTLESNFKDQFQGREHKEEHKMANIDKFCNVSSQRRLNIRWKRKEGLLEAILS